MNQIFSDLLKIAFIEITNSLEGVCVPQYGQSVKWKITNGNEWHQELVSFKRIHYYSDVIRKYVAEYKCLENLNESLYLAYPECKDNWLQIHTYGIKLSASTLLINMIHKYYEQMLGNPNREKHIENIFNEVCLFFDSDYVGIECIVPLYNFTLKGQLGCIELKEAVVIEKLSDNQREDIMNNYLSGFSDYPTRIPFYALIDERQIIGYYENCQIIGNRG